MCGSHLCVSSRTCTCMIGVFLGLSPSSFAFSRCGDIQHYLLLAQWFEFLFTANRNILTCQPIYKSFTLVYLIVPPY